MLTLLTSLAVIAGFSHPGATRRVLGLQTGTVLRAVSGRTLLFGSTVTGGAGFLGYHLSAQLHLQRGGTQVVLLQPRPVRVLLAVAQAGSAGAVEALGVRVVVGDMCDTPLVRRLIGEHGVTHVASMAAQAGVRFSLSHPLAYVRANVECFVSLLEALRATPGVPLVYASSSSVYGSNSKVPFSEGDRVDAPASLYAATKKENELLAHVYHGLYGMPVTGLRFFTVYGPWGRPDMAYFSFTHRIARGLPIELYGHGTPRRDFTYIDDIVDGVVGALALGAGEEIFNLGNHRTETLARFVSVLEEAVGRKAVKAYTALAPGDVPTTYADIAHAQALLGYQPRTSIEDGLRAFVQWYRSADFRAEYAEEGQWRAPPEGARADPSAASAPPPASAAAAVRLTGQ